MKKSHLVSIAVITLLFLGCGKDPFTTKGIAEDFFFLKSGNQHMPVTVAGNVDSRKFVVIIHGGPGGNGLDYRDKQAKALAEKEFAVVYWDQRFAGNSQGNGGNTDILEFRADIKKLLLILRSKYGSDIELYLLGHSWGGFLAPYFLVDGANHAMVNGWIQVGGAHNYRLNDSLTREMLLRYGHMELAAGNNTSTWTEMVNWCNQNGFEGDENAAKLNGFAQRAESLFGNVLEPEGSDEQQAKATFSHWSNEMATTRRKIDQPGYTTPNSDQLFNIKIPTLLLWGKYDFVCPSELANDIQKNIGSADVSKIIYLNSGHSPMVNEPEKFWADAINWVKAH